MESFEEIGLNSIETIIKKFSRFFPSNQIKGIEFVCDSQGETFLSSFRYSYAVTGRRKSCKERQHKSNKLTISRKSSKIHRRSSISATVGGPSNPEGDTNKRAPSAPNAPSTAIKIARSDGEPFSRSRSNFVRYLFQR